MTATTAFLPLLRYEKIIYTTSFSRFISTKQNERLLSQFLLTFFGLLHIVETSVSVQTVMHLFSN